MKLKIISIVTAFAVTISGSTAAPATVSRTKLLGNKKDTNTNNNDNNKISSPSHSYIRVPNNNNPPYQSAVTVAMAAHEVNSSDRDLKWMIESFKDTKAQAASLNDDALASKYEGLLDDEGSKRLTLSEDKKLVFKGLILMKVSKIGLKGYITVEQGRKIFRLLFHDEGEDETSLEDVHNMVVGLGGRKLQEDDDEKFWLLIGAIGEGLSDGLSFEEATSVEYLVEQGFTPTEVLLIADLISLPTSTSTSSTSTSTQASTSSQATSAATTPQATSTTQGTEITTTEQTSTSSTSSQASSTSTSASEASSTSSSSTVASTSETEATTVQSTTGSSTSLATSTQATTTELTTSAATTTDGTTVASTTGATTTQQTDATTSSEATTTASLPTSKPSLSISPSTQPSEAPSTSFAPTETSSPSLMPSDSPSSSTSPSLEPSDVPSSSAQPSLEPSDVPSQSSIPSLQPSVKPSISTSPSLEPSELPSTSTKPSLKPTPVPVVTTTTGATTTQQATTSSTTSSEATTSAGGIPCNNSPPICIDGDLNASVKPTCTASEECYEIGPTQPDGQPDACPSINGLCFDINFDFVSNGDDTTCDGTNVCLVCTSCSTTTTGATTTQQATTSSTTSSEATTSAGGIPCNNSPPICIDGDLNASVKPTCTASEECYEIGPTQPDGQPDACPSINGLCFDINFDFVSNGDDTTCDGTNVCLVCTSCS